MDRHMIKMAAKVYQCQDAAKKIYGKEYPEKVKFYVDFVKAFSEKEQLDTLQSILKICEDKEVLENGMAVMLLMAAAVEIIEPEEINNRLNS